MLSNAYSNQTRLLYYGDGRHQDEEAQDYDAGAPEVHVNDVAVEIEVRVPVCLCVWFVCAVCLCMYVCVSVSVCLRMCLYVCCV